MTMTRRAVVTLAAVALGAGVFVSSVATAAPPVCGKKACSEEIAAGCAGLSGRDLSVCSKSVIANCKTGSCSCTGEIPACGPTTTTTTSTTTTTTIYGSPSRAFLALPADLLD
jgi:hypothetical protein